MATFSDFSYDSESPFAILDRMALDQLSPIKDNQYIPTCQHTVKTFENNAYICSLCGEEVETYLDAECPVSEYTQSFMSQPRTRTIQPLLTTMGFPADVRELADTIYLRLTNGDIHRGKPRYSYILASVFEAYKQLGHDTITMHYLRNRFDLSKNRSHPGRKKVMVKAKQENTITSSYTSPVNLVPEMLSKWKVSESSLKEIGDIYAEVEANSDINERSRPNSIAAGLIYYYMLRTGRGCKLQEFAKTVGIQENTIKKVACNISKVLNTPHIC